MAKQIYFTALCGAFFFICGMGWLTYVNRSNWTIVTVFLAVLGATVVMFIAPIFLLKSSEVHLSCPTSIIVDRTTGFPVSYFAENHAMAEMIQRATYEEEKGKPGRMIPRSVDLSSPDKRFDYYIELIQYQLLQQSYVALRSSNRISAGVTPAGSDVKNETFEFFRPKEFDEIPGAKIAEAIDSNRFFGAWERRWWLDKRISLPVPKDTIFKAQGKNAIAFYKPNHFKITMSIEPQGSMTGCPAHLQKFIQNGNVDTIAYVINCHGIFEKFASFNPETEDNKKWAQVLFSRIKGDLADQN